MRNLGATCYLNAFLQLAFEVLPFRELILRNKAVGGYIASLAVLFAELQLSSRVSIDTTRLVEDLCIAKGEQQDIQEFWTLFLGNIEETLRKSELVSEEDKDQIKRIFEGSESIRLTCGTCGYTSVRNDVFRNVAISLSHEQGGGGGGANGNGASGGGGGAGPDLSNPGNSSLGGFACPDAKTTLELGVNSILAPEFLTGREQYFCEKCQRKMDASRRAVWETMPPVLVFSLNRFVYDPLLQQRKKVSVKASFGPTITLGSDVYELAGVATHTGVSADSGHYRCTTRDPGSGLWTLFDDTTVSSPSETPMAGLRVVDNDGDSSDAFGASGSALNGKRGRPSGKSKAQTDSARVNQDDDIEDDDDADRDQDASDKSRRNNKHGKDKHGKASQGGRLKRSGSAETIDDDNDKEGSVDDDDDDDDDYSSNKNNNKNRNKKKKKNHKKNNNENEGNSSMATSKSNSSKVTARESAAGKTSISVFDQGFLLGDGAAEEDADAEDGDNERGTKARLKGGGGTKGGARVRGNSASLSAANEIDVEEGEGDLHRAESGAVGKRKRAPRDAEGGEGEEDDEGERGPAVVDLDGAPPSMSRRATAPVLSQTLSDLDEKGCYASTSAYLLMYVRRGGLAARDPDTLGQPRVPEELKTPIVTDNTNLEAERQKFEQNAAVFDQNLAKYVDRRERFLAVAPLVDPDAPYFWIAKNWLLSWIQRRGEGYAFDEDFLEVSTFGSDPPTEHADFICKHGAVNVMNRFKQVKTVSPAGWALLKEECPGLAAAELSSERNCSLCVGEYYQAAATRKQYSKFLSDLAATLDAGIPEGGSAFCLSRTFLDVLRARTTAELPADFEPSLMTEGLHCSCDPPQGLGASSGYIKISSRAKKLLKRTYPDLPWDSLLLDAAAVTPCARCESVRLTETKEKKSKARAWAEERSSALKELNCLPVPFPLNQPYLAFGHLQGGVAPDQGKITDTFKVSATSKLSVKRRISDDQFTVDLPDDKPIRSRSPEIGVDHDPYAFPGEEELPSGGEVDVDEAGRTSGDDALSRIKGSGKDKGRGKEDGASKVSAKVQIPESDEDFVDTQRKPKTPLPGSGAKLGSSSPGTLFVVPGLFCDQWQAAFGPAKEAAIGRPTTVNFSGLLCDHGQVLFDLNEPRTDEAAARDLADRLRLVRGAAWDEIVKRYPLLGIADPAGIEVRLQETGGSKRFVTVPGICEPCFAKHKAEERTAKVGFVEGPVFVKLERPAPTFAFAGAGSSTGTRTRGARGANASVPRPIIASYSTPVALFKLMVFEGCEGSPEPAWMRLEFNGRVLDDSTKTLGHYGVLRGSTLTLSRSDVADAVDPFAMVTGKKPAAETGFAGSLLVSSSLPRLSSMGSVPTAQDTRSTLEESINLISDDERSEGKQAPAPGRGGASKFHEADFWPKHSPGGGRGAAKPGRHDARDRDDEDGDDDGKDVDYVDPRGKNKNGNQDDHDDDNDDDTDTGARGGAKVKRKVTKSQHVTIVPDSEEDEPVRTSVRPVARKSAVKPERPVAEKAAKPAAKAGAQAKKSGEYLDPTQRNLGDMMITPGRIPRKGAAQGEAAPVISLLDQDDDFEVHPRPKPRVGRPVSAGSKGSDAKKRKARSSSSGSEDVGKSRSAPTRGKRGEERMWDRITANESKGRSAAGRTGGDDDDDSMDEIQDSVRRRRLPQFPKALRECLLETVLTTEARKPLDTTRLEQNFDIRAVRGVLEVLVKERFIEKDPNRSDIYTVNGEKIAELCDLCEDK